MNKSIDKNIIKKFDKTNTMSAKSKKFDKKKNIKLALKESEKNIASGSKKNSKKRIVGSCDYIDIPYEKQLIKKQTSVENLLSKYAKVEKIVSMENPYRYRNKVVATFGYTRGKIIAGTYERGTHNIIESNDYLIEDELACNIIATIKDLAVSFKMKTYDEDRGYGFLRHVLVRVGKKTGEVMVVLVTSNPVFVGKNNFIKALRNFYPNITTIIQNINAENTSMVLGDREIILYGKGYIEDILCGLKFRISSKSFYQVNPIQTEKLYTQALKLAKLEKDMYILDAYSGVGTIGLIAAKDVKKVISVELNRDAVRDGISNAKVNSIKNVEFYNADATEFISSMARERSKIDVLIMDPPRSGSTKEFISSVLSLEPKRVVYISCNPETLERDLQSFIIGKKYKISSINPFDCFAMTSHVECIALLVRATK